MLFGLIGEHVEKSHSKYIHGAFADYQYDLCSIPPDEIKAFLDKGEFQGLNVTMPYKLTVIPYCDELSPAAKKIGAVNTLVRRGGKLCGDNTDYAGFLYLARRAKIGFEGKKVLVLGTGGTSLTVSTAARDSGAREVVRISRSGEEDYASAHERHADAEIIVNTTPVGSSMVGLEEEMPISLDGFDRLEGVLDVVYSPLRTKLMLAAEARGIPCSTGLSMLVAQAKYAAEQFAGHEIDDARIDEVHSDLHKKLANIVFIGMSGTGKTTMAGACAPVLGREFIDIDNEIIKRVGCSIPEYFASHGEAAFRDVESDVIRDLSPRSGLVIATGGGSILRPENVDRLRANSVMIRLNRPLSVLPTDGRPMLKNRTVEELAKQREPLYKIATDIIVDNIGPVERVRDSIIEAWRAALLNK